MRTEKFLETMARSRGSSCTAASGFTNTEKILVIFGDQSDRKATCGPWKFVLFTN